MIGDLRQRDPRRVERDYKGFIAGLSCIACACSGKREKRVVVAHVRMALADAGWRETGMAEKPSDRRTVPLCDPHHRDDSKVGQHRVGERTFWDELGVNAPDLCAALSKAFDLGLPGDPIVWAFAAKARLGLTIHGLADHRHDHEGSLWMDHGRRFAALPAPVGRAHSDGQTTPVEQGRFQRPAIGSWSGEAGGEAPPRHTGRDRHRERFDAAEVGPARRTWESRPRNYAQWVRHGRVTLAAPPPPITPGLTASAEPVCMEPLQTFDFRRERASIFLHYPARQYPVPAEAWRWIASTGEVVEWGWGGDRDAWTTEPIQTYPAGAELAAPWDIWP